MKLSILLKTIKLIDWVDAGTHEKKTPLFFGFKAGMLLRIKVGEIPIFLLSTMLLIKKELFVPFHDVDENKWTYRIFGFPDARWLVQFTGVLSLLRW